MTPTPQTFADAFGPSKRRELLFALRARLGRTFSDDELEDFIHDAALAVWARVRAGEGPANVAGLLYVAALNRARDRLKSAAYTRERLSDHESGALRLIAAPAPADPAIALELHTSAREALEVLSELPARARSVFELRVLQELAPAEIQRRLEMSPRTYKRELRKACDQIAAAADGGGPAPAPTRLRRN